VTTSSRGDDRDAGNAASVCAFDRIIREAQRAVAMAYALEQIASIADDHPGSEAMQSIYNLADEALNADA